MVERVVARHQPLASRTGIALEIGVPHRSLRVVGDETLISQAFGNLVHNAVRHNRAGGHAAVTLDPAGPEFVFRVRDDGPGVADADLGRLGQRWWRSGEARTRSPDGHGLGLAITRRVCERHGCTMELRLPAAGGLEVEIRGSREVDGQDPG